MFIKQIFIVISVSVLFFSGAASAQNSWVNASATIRQVPFEIYTDGRVTANAVLGIDFIKTGMTIWKNNDNAVANCTLTGKDILSLRFTSLSQTVGSVAQIEGNVWRNMIFLGMASGRPLTIDFNASCEIYDMRLS